MRREWQWRCTTHSAGTGAHSYEVRTTTKRTVKRNIHIAWGSTHAEHISEVWWKYRKKIIFWCCCLLWYFLRYWASAYKPARCGEKGLRQKGKWNTTVPLRVDTQRKTHKPSGWERNCWQRNQIWEKNDKIIKGRLGVGMSLYEITNPGIQTWFFFFFCQKNKFLLF